MRPDLRTVVLCGSPADVENELCRNVALKAAAMASMLPVRAWNDTCCHVGDDAPVANPLWDFTCQHLEEFIEFRPGNKTSGRLPEVWSKFGWFDKPTAAEQSAFRVKERKYGPPERLPMVHFQVCWYGRCPQCLRMLRAMLLMLLFRVARWFLQAHLHEGIAVQ